MEETFKRIPPEDVFITVFKRKPTEEELWMGVPPDFDGNLSLIHISEPTRH